MELTLSTYDITEELFKLSFWTLVFADLIVLFHVIVSHISVTCRFNMIITFFKIILMGLKKYNTNSQTLDNSQYVSWEKRNEKKK